MLQQLALKLDYEAGFLPTAPYPKSIKFRVYKYIDKAAVQRQLDRVKKASQNMSASDIVSLYTSEENSNA